MDTPGFSFPYLLKFIRFRVSLAVTFSAFGAAVVATGGFSAGIISGLAGIFLLAGGASALNQVQEKKIDERMERTSSRPLPQKVLSERNALLVAVLILLSGLIILFFQNNKNAFWLGVFNIIWYNGLYTYLKRKTAFAVVPGSLTGAIPLLMGWCVAGGSLMLYEPWLLAFFMFMWQIPHFWLLMLRYGFQYQLAGLPSLPDHFHPRQMKNIIFAWILAASMSSILLTVLELWHLPLLKICILLMNLFLIIYTFYSLYLSQKDNRHLFMLINVFMMLVFVLLMADRLFI